MNLGRLAGLGLVLVMGLVGCGSEEESDPAPAGGTVNTAIAKSTAASTINAVNLAINSGDGPGAAFALASVGSAAFGIVTQGGTTTGQSVGTAQQKLTTGTCDCTGTSCNFVDCGTDDPGAAWTINGTLSWDAGTVNCDLSITGDVQGLTYSIHEMCALTVTPTSIDGTLSTDGSYDMTGMAGGGGYNTKSEWNATVTFNDVQYGAGGCPTSGSVDVSSTVTVSGSEFSGSGSVTFDGTC